MDEYGYLAAPRAKFMEEEYDRRPIFPPGTPIGDRYVVEGLVRLSERRMFYLVTEHQVRGRGPLFDVLSMKSKCFEPYERFIALGLEHPGLKMPTDHLRHAGQLLSFIPYSGEELMLDEAAPLPE